MSSFLIIFITYLFIANVSSLIISHSIRNTFDSYCMTSTHALTYRPITGVQRKHITIRSKTNENVWKEFKSSLEDYWNSLKKFMGNYKDKSARQQFISEFRNGTEVIVDSVIRNSKEGEMGKRGEEFVATTFFLVLLTLLNVHPIISIIFRLAGFISLLSGFLFVSTSIVEMRDQISFLVVPVANQRLISAGIYQVVRHPMYGGLLSLCTGIAMLNRSAEKVLFSIALGFVLVRMKDENKPPTIPTRIRFTVLLLFRNERLKKKKSFYEKSIKRYSIKLISNSLPALYSYEYCSGRHT